MQALAEKLEDDRLDDVRNRGRRRRVRCVVFTKIVPRFHKYKIIINIRPLKDFEF